MARAGCPSPEDREQLRKAAEAELNIDNGNGAADAEEQEGKSQIQVNNRQLRDIVEDAEQALLKNNTRPIIFQRDGTLVWIRKNERGRCTIERLSEPAMRAHLTDCADFNRVNKDGHRTQVHPPRDVAQTLLAKSKFSYPGLQGVVEAPVIRPDGTILETPGYDPQTQLFYNPVQNLNSAIPKRISKNAVRAAVALLCEDLLVDFPFCVPADRANMLALLLTPLLRPVIEGPVPLALLDKPTPGSGASLLVDLVSVIVCGEPAAKEILPEGRSAEEELRKKITSILMYGAPLAVFDNVEQDLRSSTLSMVVTTRWWQDRILGRNETVRLPVNVTWVITGNNIRVRGDIARRSYRIRIDSCKERPWERTEFRHPEIIAWTQKNRGKLVSALLIIARAWFMARQPSVKTPHLGGFERWVAVVGGMLANAGVPAFLENQADLYTSVDEEGPEWGAFLAVWHHVFGGKPSTVAELCDNPALRESLPESLFWNPDKLDASKKKLGHALKKRIDRPYSGYRLTRADMDSHTKTARWYVKEVAGSAGSASTAAQEKNGAENEKAEEKTQYETDSNQTRRTTQTRKQQSSDPVTQHRDISQPPADGAPDEAWRNV